MEETNLARIYGLRHKVAHCMPRCRL